MQRLAAVVRWIAPSVLAGLLAGVAFTARWLESRASREDVGAEVGKATAIAKAAQTDAHHASSLVDDHAQALAALWMHVVEMRAELLVWRAYSRADAGIRSGYIQQARQFYVREFELQLSTHRHPAEAARLALLAQWRPDK